MLSWSWRGKMSQKDIHTLENKDCMSSRNVRIWVPPDSVSNLRIREPPLTLLWKSLNFNDICSLRFSSKPALLFALVSSKPLSLSAQFLALQKIRTTCVLEQECFHVPVTCCDNSGIGPELSIPSSPTISNLNQTSLHSSYVNNWCCMYLCMVMCLSCSNY